MSQSSAIIGHCNGLPSPPDSEIEESSQNQMQGFAALGVLQKFNERTVLSVGTTSVAKLYQKEIFHLACSVSRSCLHGWASLIVMQYSFLRSIVTTLTLLHDRHLSGTQAISRAILSHWYEGTAKFKDTLMKPVQNEARDALWASASLLGVIQFASCDARTPEEAWPLRPSHNTDLDWLKMSDGKKAVFAITNPLRADSVFCTMSVGHDKMFGFMKESCDKLNPAAIDLTRDFSDMFDLGPISSAAANTNPYYKPAMTMARLLHTTCDGNNILEFFGFMMHMGPRMKALLDQKDAKALLLVSYWFAKLYRTQWWLQRRGLMEGRAICMYLDRFHGDDAKLQRMLEWPKAEFGLELPSRRPSRISEWTSDAGTVLCVM